jgi:hypothetical protein
MPRQSGALQLLVHRPNPLGLNGYAKEASLIWLPLRCDGVVRHGGMFSGSLTHRSIEGMLAVSSDYRTVYPALGHSLATPSGIALARMSVVARQNFRKDGRYHSIRTGRCRPR